MLQHNYFLTTPHFLTFLLSLEQKYKTDGPPFFNISTPFHSPSFFSAFLLPFHFTPTKHNIIYLDID